MAARVSIHSIFDADSGATVVRVTKQPLPNDTGDRRAEARWLAEVHHSGVVNLHEVTDDPFTIITDHVPGQTLRNATATPDEGALALAAVTDTLADLHAAGRAHGKITLDHIILGPDGAVLCSPDGTVCESTDDLAGMADCMSDLGQQWLASGLSRPFDGSWGALADRLRNLDDPSMSARRVGQQLRRMSESREPKDSGPVHEPSVRWRGMAVLAAALTVMTAGLILSRSPTPESELGPRVIVAGSEFAVGRPGDRVVALEQPCDPDSPVLLLESESSIVWRYPLVGEDAPAVAVAVVPGATTLRIRWVEGDDAPNSADPCEAAVAQGPAGASLIETWRD